MTDAFVEFRLQEFLYNAGVLGLLRLLRYDEDFACGCRRGVDYRLEGQSLWVRRAYLLERDIGALYVKTAAHSLGSETKIQGILDRKGRLDALCQQPQPEDKAWKKEVDGIYKELTDKLAKNRLQSACIIFQKQGLDAPINPLAASLKAEPDYEEKKALYDRLHAVLTRPEIHRVLLFKDILYGRINMFYADNKGSGAAFFSNRETDPGEAFNEKFLSPLRVQLADEEEAPDYGKRCIQCGGLSAGKTKAGAFEAVPISLFVATADDLRKKKSYYWNLEPDAYLCPACAFICSLSPLGFQYLGKDAVFINNNADVKTLEEFGALLAETGNMERGGAWTRLRNALTSQRIRALHGRIFNIQVVIRDRDAERYSLNLIDRRTLQILEACEKPLSYLQPRVVKIGDEYVNVYAETVENIVRHRRQYPLLTRLLRQAASDAHPCDYLWNILTVQINSRGGNNVENDKSVKRAYVAKMAGLRLRAELTDPGASETDRDNRLRGLVYQLLNAAALQNRERFLELILRTYSGIGAAVPDIFFGCFASDEDFQELAFAFLLGLKSAGKEKNDNRNQEERDHVGA